MTIVLFSLTSCGIIAEIRGPIQVRIKNKDFQKVAVYEADKIKVYVDAKKLLKYTIKNTSQWDIGEREAMEEFYQDSDTLLIYQLNHDKHLTDIFLANALRKGQVKIISDNGKVDIIQKKYGCPGSTIEGWGWSFFYKVDDKWEKFFYKKFVSCEM